MTIREIIICSFKLSSLGRELNDTQTADLLFDIFLDFIVRNKWLYFPDGGRYGRNVILDFNITKNLHVNCFELSQMFVELCQQIGIKSAETFIYKNKPFNKIGQQEVKGLSHYTYTCFDKQFNAIDNQVCFNQHCVTIVNNRFYDLVFSCVYDQESFPCDLSPLANVFSHIYFNDEESVLLVLNRLDDKSALEQTFAGETLLHIAAKKHFSKVVSYLLNQGVNANSLSKLESPTVALAHISDNNSPLFQLLSTKTDSLVVEDIVKNNWLSQLNRLVTIIANDGENVDKFLQELEGIDINFKNDEGWTLLHFAVYYDNKKMAELLIQKGADASIKDNIGKVPLSYVNDVELFTFLSAKTEPLIIEEIQYERRDDYFFEAVTVITDDQDIEQLSILLPLIDINAQNSNGWTLLHFAALHNNVAMITFLLDKGADATIKETIGLLPLQLVKDKNSHAYDCLAHHTKQAFQPVTHHHVSQVTNRNDSILMTLGMPILGGFIAVIGCAAVATALVLLHDSSLNIGLLTLGIASMLGGIGLFAIGMRKPNRQDQSMAFFDHTANSFC